MKKTIIDYKLAGKRVIVRSDLNVPIKNGVIGDDNRIKESIETIKFISQIDGKVIVMSHLGRVKTEADKSSSTLLPVAQRLSELLQKEIKFIPQTQGEQVENAIKNMKNGEVVMIENTRFEDIEGEKESSNDVELGKYWASLGDVFINDAFGTSHRAHASNVGIASNLPSGVGFLVEKEIERIGNIINNPKRPFVVILGGAKVSDKICVIKNLVNKADKIIIGGGMCFTFLKALGYNIGLSLLEEGSIDFCKDLLASYKDKIVLPLDINVSLEYSPIATSKIVDIDMINYNEMGLDIGPKTIQLFKDTLKNAKSIVWNGPMGVFEFDKYNIGTKQLCDFLVKQNAKVIIGGGDSAAFVNKFGFKDKFYHVSTGGGATLELLEGKSLPGIDIISNK